jgi:MYXO-CTERM domain-containing protein
MKKLLITTALAAGLATGAHASGTGTVLDPFMGVGTCDSTGSFCIQDPDADDVKMFLENDKNVNTFYGSTTGNGSHFTDTILINTMGYVDTSSGFATIKPVKDGTLTQAIYTPQAQNLFDGFFTRGQLVYTDPNPCAKNDKACVPNVAPDGATVLMQINGGPVFGFFEGLPQSNDFASIGVDEPGENEKLAGLISSVKIWVTTPNVSFFEIKQADWSPCASTGSGCVTINQTGGAPEPSTWMMGLLGFGFVGGLALRRQRQPISLVG